MSAPRATGGTRFPDTLLGRLFLVAVVSVVPVALAAGVAIFA